MDLTYGFNYGAADNGNVQSIANNINTARSQTYTYDELNRVSTAKTTATSGTYSWGLQFGYDPWANLLSTAVTQGSAYSFSVYADGSNRIHNTGGTFTYDTAGNLTADPVNSSYTYNAEGELTSAAGVTYTYDGEGNRVKKSSGKLYWYGLGSDPLSESDASGNLTNEYIFLGGTRIAMLQLSNGNAVNYYIQDHLGSSRIVTNAGGSVPPLDDSDFYPFGGERSYASGSGNNYKFTGKERDAESGLDDFAARFYTSNYGRFLSADDSKYVKPADPQTWNLYSYVANNPINAVDPTGHAPEGANGRPRLMRETDDGGPTAVGPSMGTSTEAESIDPSDVFDNIWVSVGDDGGGPAGGNQKKPPVQNPNKQNNNPPTVEQIETDIRSEAKAYAVPAEIALATAKKESTLDPNKHDGRDWGLMGINESQFGGKLTDGAGNKFTVDGDRVRSDWQYNVHVGMAILRNAYVFAQANRPDDVARATYARYNAPGHWKQYYEFPSHIVGQHVSGFYTYYLQYGGK
jgi:RHS repeat-associated protein